MACWTVIADLCPVLWSDPDKYSSDIKLVMFFEAIVQRAGLYTLNGTFEEILAYIWGTRHPLDASDIELWQSFYEWLLIDTGLNGPLALRQFRERFTDDESAKKALLEKMVEFRELQSTLRKW
jgi:hypothetical protein